jgi:hypothetical protein
MTQTAPNKRLQGDALQRPLVPRFRFQARLKRSVGPYKSDGEPG